MTPKNNPIFDVVATTKDGSKAVSIQVKTRSVRNKQGWKLGKDIAKGEAPKDLFVVLVNLIEHKKPEFYIYEYNILSNRVSDVYNAYINTLKKDGSQRKEVGFRWFDEISFTDNDKSRKNNWKPIIEALSHWKNLRLMQNFI